MRVKGKIYESGETIPMAKVYVSDAKGNMNYPKNATLADLDGNYSISVFPSEYITANFVGQKQTINVSDICKGGGDCKYNFNLQPAMHEGVTIIGQLGGNKQERTPAVYNWRKIALIGAASLIGISLMIYGTSKLIKQNK